MGTIAVLTMGGLLLALFFKASSKTAAIAREVQEIKQILHEEQAIRPALHLVSRAKGENE